MFTYTCREVYCKCDLNKEAGGGIVGRAQRLPPKQNDNTCFHRQSYLIFFGTIFAIIFGIFSGNICALSVSFLPSFLAFIFFWSSIFFLILSFFWSSVFFWSLSLLVLSGYRDLPRSLISLPAVFQFSPEPPTTMFKHRFRWTWHLTSCGTALLE